jgi:hypothetical protein
VNARLPSLPGACQALEETLHLLVDRELGPAEEAGVEAHLVACPRCMRRARELEALSSLLKGWEARTLAAPAPRPRLQRSVLARIAPEAARRRAEARGRRMLDLVRVAAVVLVLVGAAAFGLAAGASGSVGSDGPKARAPSFVADAARRPALPSADPSVDAVLAGLSFPEIRFTPDEAATGDLPRPDLRSVYLAAPPEVPPLLAEIEHARRRASRYDSIVGRLGVFVAMPRQEARLLPMRLTPEVLRFLEAEGLLLRWSAWADQARMPSSPTSAPEAAPRPTDVALAEAVPLAAVLAPGFTNRPRLAVGAEGRRDLEHTVLVAYPVQESDLPGHGLKTAEKPVQALDPIAAQDAGSLRLDESGRGDGALVLLVQESTLPIFVPAGQFVTGRGPDRVVARSLWLPPNPGRTPVPHEVATFEVGRDPLGARRDDGRLELAPCVAGPALRALLVSGATPGEVYRAALAQYRALLRPGAVIASWEPWSLLDSFHSQAPAHRRAQIEEYWSRSRPIGFLVVDGGPDGGALRGLETTRLAGDARADLLARLFYGYEREALATAASGRAAAYGPRASESLARVRVSEETLFEVARDGAGDVRSLRRASAALGVAVESVVPAGVGAVASSLLALPEAAPR